MKNMIVLIFLSSCLILMNCEEGGNSVIGSKDHDIKSATAKDPEILANGIATTRILVNVKNKKDNTSAYGMKVHFVTTAGSIQEYGTTDANGNAEVTLRSAASENDLIAEITATVLDTTFSPLNKTASGPFEIEFSLPDFESYYPNEKKVAKENEAQDNRATIRVKFLGISLETELEDSILPADGVSETKVEITLRERTSRKVVTDAEIRFVLTYGTIRGSVETDDEGKSEVYLKSGKKAINDTLVVEYGNKITQRIPVSYVTPKFSLNPKKARVPADGISKVQMIATLLTQQNTPIPGAKVKFSTTAGVIFESAYTNSYGQATVDLVSAKQPDSLVKVVAKFLSLSDSAIISFGSIDVKSITFIGDADLVIRDGKSSTQIGLIAKNVLGLPVANVVINLKTNIGSVPETIVTDQQGSAQFKFTADGGSSDAIATITASAGTVQATKTVNLLGVSMVVTANPASILADGKSNSSIRVELKQTTSHLAVSGQALTFAVDLGTMATNASTDNQGVATITYTAGNVPGIANVTVICGGLISTVKVALLANFPKNISLNVDSEPILRDGVASKQMSLQVTNDLGQPVANVAVNIAANLGGVPGSVITDQQGYATVKYTADAGNSDATATITASVGTIQSTRTVKLLGITMAITANPTSILADGIATSVIRVEVKETVTKTAVTNHPISFAADLGTIPTTASTDNQGIATITYTASTTPGTATITGSLGTLKFTQPIILLGVRISLTAAPDSIAADGKSTTSIRVEVKQTNSNIAVPNQLINFAADKGTIPATATTNDQGVAILTFTSSMQPGTATITATCGTLVQTVKVYLFDNFANSILLSAEPNFIWVKGTGHIQQTIITAKILGVTGQPVTNEYGVRFRIVNSPGGGEKIEPSTGSGMETTVIRTVNGKAEAKFLAGTVSGAVQIRAELVDVSQVNAQTTNIIIRSGPPYIWIDPANINNVISHMTLAVEPGKHNVAFGNPFQEIKITAYLGDRYNNPVEDETVVYLTATGGYITTNAVTCEKGQASAILQNVNPFPYLFSNDPNQLTALNIPNPNNEVFNKSLTVPIALPDFEGGEVFNSIGTTKENDGMAVILAYTWGQDQNGNNAKVWTTGRVIYSTGVARFTAVTNKTELAIGESATISIRVYDTHGNPVAAGSSLNVSTTAGELSDTNLMPSADRYGFGTTFFTVQLLNNLKPEDKATTAMVKINLDSPNGTGKITIPIALKLTP